MDSAGFFFVETGHDLKLTRSAFPLAVQGPEQRCNAACQQQGEDETQPFPQGEGFFHAAS